MKEQYRLKLKIGRLRVREWNKNITKEKEMKMEIKHLENKTKSQHYDIIKTKKIRKHTKIKEEELEGKTMKKDEERMRKWK